MLPRRVLSLSIRTLALAVPLLGIAVQSDAGEIKPFLTCVRPIPEPATGAFTVEASFGYISDLPGPVTLPIGEQNFFTPGVEAGPARAGQQGVPVHSRPRAAREGSSATSCSTDEPLRP